MKRVIPVSIVYVSILTWVVFNLSSCANIIAPTGGPKDSLPPILDTARSFPRLEQLNYKGNKVELYFDEWVKAPKLKQELIITPRVKDYTFKISKKRLRIVFTQPLDSNTTYNLDFRESIQDITEGNPIPIRLAFSTGSLLDTMEIKGRIVNPLTNTAAKKVLLALYKADDTLDVAKDPPYYLTETNGAGLYHFKNIKANRYRLYAIADQNNNKYYNKNESIGFVKDVIDLTQSSKDSLDMDLVKEDYDAPRIASKLPNKHYFEINFNEGLENVKIDSGQTNIEEKVLYSLTGDGKKLIFYNMKKLDSLRIRVIAEDSTKNKFSEEVTLRFRNKRIKKRDLAAFKVSIAPKNNIGIAGKQLELKINFTKPVKSFVPEKLKYQIDVDTVNIKPLLDDSSSKFEWNQFKTQLSITRPVSFKKAIHLIADSAAFVSAVNDSSTTSKTTIKRIDPTQIGVINIAVETQSNNFIVQMINQEFKVIREHKSSENNRKNLKFDNLAPGSYSIRVIIDTNNNGKWDFSDYKKGIPSEKIIFHNKEIQLRANWEQNITLKF